ncbi:hypothetical protein EK21DRAFT_90188 [Setomelanomma holmii]|uniref:Uncharacterized protein n=1 Tax=Setomelanomma holmii TaxID=210430 RepID=A0A9P4H996_9PLEO|nr:hypothetical protein EK21DRAFT_90188 [Setomelanomma holmii]
MQPSNDGRMPQMLLGMRVLVEADLVWRQQGRVVNLQRRRWGHWGHCGGSGMQSENASSKNSQTSQDGPGPGGRSRSVNGQAVAALGWSHVHKSVGVVPLKRDAQALSHWARATALNVAIERPHWQKCQYCL